MVYIKGLNVKTFRGITDLDIQDFSEINIITGENNCGKTSLLEVIHGISFPLEMSNWISSVRSRDVGYGGLDSYESLKDIFDINAPEKKVDVAFCDKDGDCHSIQISAEEHVEVMTEKERDKLQFVKIFKLNDDDDSNDSNDDDDIYDDFEEVANVEVKSMCLYFKLINSNGEIAEKENIIYDFTRRMITNRINVLSAYKSVYIAPFQHTSSIFYLKEVLNDTDLYNEMLTVLKKFDPDIVNINAYSEGNRTVFMLTSKKNKKALPLNVYGDGMKKVLLLMSAIVKAKDGILLLDEFETAIHTSVMSDVFSWILKTSKRLNVQLFLTSHSEEAIKKILTCDEKLKKSIRVVTLAKINGETKARVLNVDDALMLNSKFGMELR
jgi:AAA15 family ATPase/GTPase